MYLGATDLHTIEDNSRLDFVAGINSFPLLLRCFCIEVRYSDTSSLPYKC